MTKITNAMALTTAIEVLASIGNYGDTIEKLQTMLEQNNKRHVSKADKEKQSLNETLKSAILNYMVIGTKYTVTDLTKSVPALVNSEASCQKVTNLCSQLLADGLLEKTIEKRKSYYSLKDEI